MSWSSATLDSAGALKGQNSSHLKGLLYELWLHKCKCRWSVLQRQLTRKWKADQDGGKWETKVWACARHVCLVWVLVRALVSVRVRAGELLGCIGILKCDWQRRSLLGEIVNRVEPVICSRQPWKGTADSQGSYWEFQRCCLTDLGPSPRHTEPASRACSPIRADQCAFTFSLLRSVCFSAALFSE